MPDSNTQNGGMQNNEENNITNDAVNVGSNASPFIATSQQALDIEKIVTPSPSEAILNSQMKQGEAKPVGVMENLASKMEEPIPEAQKKVMNQKAFSDKTNENVKIDKSPVVKDVKEDNNTNTQSTPVNVPTQNTQASSPVVETPIANNNIQPQNIPNKNVEPVPVKTSAEIQKTVQNNNVNRVTSQTVQKTVKPVSKKTKKKSSFGIMFGGVLLFVVLLGLWGTSYMLSQDNGEILKSYGLSESNVTSVKLGIQTGFGFIGILLILILLISGLMLGGGKGKNGKRKGGSGLVFSLVFIVITGMFFSSSYKMLSKIQTTKVQTDNQTTFKASFSVYPNPAIGSAPFEISLDASEIENHRSGLFYEWDFGDGTPAGNGYQIRHTYEQTGIFNVSLSVSDGKGQSMKVDSNVVVTVNNAKPRPIITVDVSEGEIPLEVNFDASKSRDESGSIAEYRWNFDDATAQVNYAKGVQTTHTFKSPGVHEVTLTVIDNNNESVSTTQTITVLEADAGIQPKIVYSPKKGTAPLKISFNASGTTHSDENVSIVGYEWDFGDGTQKEENKIVKHIFKEEGTYLVTLVVTDSNGETATKEEEIVVESAENKPVAVILSTPTDLTGEAPFKVKLDGSNSSDEDGTITNYSWTFSDTDDVEYGKTIEHEFKEEGEYIITLMVTDDDDNETEKSVVAKVLSSGPQAPIAVLSTSPNPSQGIRPLVVDFDASESYDPDGNIIAYIWNFGEGGSNIQTSSPKTSHTFEKVGIWKVQLSVVDDTGTISVTTTDVAVNSSKPNAKITIDAEVLKSNIDILFSGRQSTGEIKEYNWKFGDGTSDKGIEVKHMFTSAGKYNVSLVVSDEVGQSDTYEMEIVVE